MKKYYPILSFTMMLLVACGQDVKDDDDSQEPQVVVQKLDKQPAQFDELAKLLPPKEVASYYDSTSRTYLSWACVTEREDSTVQSRTTLSSWNLTSGPSMNWIYTRDIPCEAPNSRIQPAFDSMHFVSFDQAGGEDIAIAYVIECKGNPDKMHLNIISSEGQQLTEMIGYPISYEPTGGIDSMELKYKSSLGTGKHAQGRIENFYEMNNYSPTNRKLIEKLWRDALRNNIGQAETIATTPAQ